LHGYDKLEGASGGSGSVHLRGPDQHKLPDPELVEDIRSAA